uniref:Gamma-gliadin n=1 Tax=Triticum aestivum x Thinopyrum elongatum TaxID=488177 RepID=B6DQD0_9POAL|nr:gamma-gliadin [Triticum aestivum x Thinopyrum elongatum]
MNIQVDPSGQVQWPQQQTIHAASPTILPANHNKYFPQPQQTFPHQPQQQFPQPQQPQQQFLQPRQPFPQQPQQPYPQQPQQPFPQTQQPQQPFPQSKQPQQPFPQPQQPQQSFPQQQPSLIQQSLQQQLNPCKNFLLQQCKPVSLVSSLWSIILPPSDCQVMRQQCCQQLAQIPQQLQCAAIHSVVHSIIMQQEQQEQLQGVQILVPLSQQQQVGQGILVQGQGIIQPQQPTQLEVIRSLVLQTLPTMCNVYVPPYCSTFRAPFASIVASIGGQYR